MYVMLMCRSYSITPMKAILHASIRRNHIQGRRFSLAKYRKKPVVIEAYQTDRELDIQTLEGTMHADVGDYIITGVKGETYPCKPDIFEQTYEPVENPC